MSQTQARPEQDYLVKLGRNFYFFLCEVYKEMGWDKFDPPDDIVQEQCDWYQFGPAKSGFLAPRSDGKTHRIVAVGAAFDHYRDPAWIIGIVSKSRKSAAETLGLIKKLYREVWFLQHLYPIDDPHARDNSEEFDVAGRPKGQRNASIWTAGMESQLPSKRAHRVFGDDVEDATNTVTLEARQTLLKRTREFDNIASFGERRVTYVGTYHHEESVYLGLINEGYQFRTWPLVAPHPDDKVVGLSPLIQKKMREGNLKPSTAKDTYDGDLVRLSRYPHDYPAEKKARGMSNFAMQFMLVASLGNALRYPLRLQNLIVFDTANNRAPVAIAWGKNHGQGMSTAIEDIRSNGFGTDALYGPIFHDKNWLPFTGVKMWIDPSGRGADKTGYAIVAHLGAMLYALDLGGLSDHTGSGHSSEVLHRLIVTAKTHNVRDIHVEDYGLQSTFAQLLEPIAREHFTEANADPAHPDGWRCSINLTRPSTSTTSKENRILDVLEPIFAQHRLVVSRSVAQNQKLQYQITRITRQRGCLQHEDELESLANACWLWQNSLNRGPAQFAEKAFEDRQRKLLDLFTPTPSKLPNWITRRR